MEAERSEADRHIAGDAHRAARRTPPAVRCLPESVAALFAESAEMTAVGAQVARCVFRGPDQTQAQREIVAGFLLPRFGHVLAQGVAHHVGHTPSLALDFLAQID